MRIVGTIAVVLLWAGPADAQSLWWSAEGLVEWSPDDPENRPGGDPQSGEGGHVIAGVRGRYHHAIGPVVFGVEAVVGHALAIADEDAYTFVEVEPRIGLRSLRVRTATTEAGGTSPTGGCQIVGNLKICSSGTTTTPYRRYTRQSESNDIFLAGLRSRPLDGRLAGTLSYRWQRTSRLVEILTGPAEWVPGSLGMAIEVGGIAQLSEPDGFEKLGPGFGGYVDFGFVWSKGLSWSSGARGGLSGLRFAASGSPEFQVLFYLGRGQAAGL